MPRRLLLAADILLDVARTVNEADRPLLESAAAELAARAEELCAAKGVPLKLSPAMAALLPSIRGLTPPDGSTGDHRRELLLN